MNTRAVIGAAAAVPPAALPTSATEITAAWLTDALRAGGLLERARVATALVEPLDAGLAMTGALARVRLEYDADAHGAPATLIAKLPTTDQNLRRLVQPMFVREVHFYQDVAPGHLLALPRVYLAAHDADSGATVLLLEDMSHALVGDVLASCEMRDAVLAITALARFHAHWWEDTRLERFDWLPLLGGDGRRSEKWFRERWPRMLATDGDQVSGRFVDDVSRALATPGAIARVVERMASAPRTLVHGDFKLDNMFFGEPGGDRPVTVFDWATCARGRGANDVGYFASTCLPPAERRAWQDHLVAVYHSTLVENGVRDYSLAECERDYGLAALLRFMRLTALLTAPELDRSSEARQRQLRCFLERVSTMLEDLGVARLVAT